MKSSTRHTISDTHFMAHVPILWALITEWVRHNVPSCLVWSINNEWVSWYVLVELPSQHISVPFSFGSLHAWLNNRQSLEDCKISLVPSGWVKNKSNCERIYNLCAHRKTHTHFDSSPLDDDDDDGGGGGECVTEKIVRELPLKHLVILVNINA